MSLKDRPLKRYRCSCGRTFAHEISLKRHRFVAGCPDDEASEEGAPGADETPTVPVAAASPTDAEATVVVQGPAGEMGVDQVQQMFLLAQHRMAGSPYAQERSAFLELLDRGFRLCGEFLWWLADLVPAVAAALGRALAGCLPVAASVVQKAGILLMFLLIALTAHRAAAPSRAASSSLLIAPAQAATFPRKISSSERPPARPQSSLAVSAPARAVEDFYADVDRGAYGPAYARLTSAWQAELPYSSFENGYRGTSGIRCHILRTWKLGGGRTQVDFLLDAREAGLPVTYRGCHTLAETPGGWILDGGNLIR